MRNNELGINNTKALFVFSNLGEPKASVGLIDYIIAIVTLNLESVAIPLSRPVTITGQFLEEVILVDLGTVSKFSERQSKNVSFQ